MLDPQKGIHKVPIVRIVGIFLLNAAKEQQSPLTHSALVPSPPFPRASEQEDDEDERTGDTGIDGGLDTRIPIIWL